MGDVEHTCRKHLAEIKTIICSSTSDKDGIQAAEEQLKELLDVAEGHRALWMPVLKTLINNPSKDRLFAVKKVLQDLTSHNRWQWKENWRDGQALIQEITEVGELRQHQGETFTDIVAAYSEIVLLLIKQLSDVKMADSVALDVVELYITMMETGSEVINLLPSNMAPVLPSFKVFKDKIPALFKRIEKLFLRKKYPWEQVNTDNAGFHFVSHVVDAYETSSQIPVEVNKSFSTIFGCCLGPANIRFLHWADDSTIIYKKLMSFMTPFCKPNEKVRSKKVLKPLVPVVIKMLKKPDEDYVYQVGLSAIQKIAEIKSDHLVEYLSSIIEWYKAVPNPFALTVLTTVYRENGDEIDKECFPELFAAILQDGENTKMHIHVLWEIAGKTPEVFTEDNIVEMIAIYIDDSVVGGMMLGILDKITAKFPERLSPDLLIEMFFREMKFQEGNAVFLSKVVVNVGLYREAHVDSFIKELIAFNKKCVNPMCRTAIVNGIKTLGEKYGMQKLKPYKAYLEDLKQNCDSSELKSAVESTIDAMENRSLAKVSGEVKQQGKKINVLDKKVTKTTKEVAVVKQTVKKHEVQITNVKAGLKDVNQRVDVVEEDLNETKVKVEEIDKKTMTNAPAWSRDVTKLMNPQAEHDWRLLASRLGYSNNDIKGWATQNDPCMALLSEWYATHKTIEATHGVLTALQEMNRQDAAAIVENAMKAVEGIVEEAPEYTTPPPIFLSYQWGHQNEVKLLRNHLQMAGYECWMDIGQMGGGDKLFEKIDDGIRGAKIIICCVSEKYAKSPNCNREVNLSVNLGKPMIPLLMEKMSWPPKGSMGPIFSEYLFIRFFQRGGEETKDDRYWPVPKFQELLMQINLEVLPDDALVTKEYKEWWKPVAEEIVIIKKEDKGQGSQPQQMTDSGKEENKSPDVFISYQWGKQPQIKQLYRRLVELGFSCWMDIYQMGGGDSLYDKIDRGVRGCKVVLSCVTTKYALSANCRREVSLADSIKKPIIPLLLEKIDWPPTGPMSMVFTQLLFINFYRDEKVQMTWRGDKFDELLGKIKENFPHLCMAEDNETKPNQENNKISDKGELNLKDDQKPTEVVKPDTQIKEPPRPKGSQQTKASKTPASRQTPEPIKVASDPNIPETQNHKTPKSEEIPKKIPNLDRDLGKKMQYNNTQTYTQRADDASKQGDASGQRKNEPETAPKKSSACTLL